MGIVNGRTSKSFRTCRNKGFHITFNNGWTVSVQFGPGNYSDNYDLIFEDFFDNMIKKPDLESNTAEIYCFNWGKTYPKSPLAYQSPAQLLKIMNKVSKFPINKKKLRRTLEAKGQIKRRG